MKELNNKRFVFTLCIPFLTCVFIYLAEIMSPVYGLTDSEKESTIKLILIAFITLKVLLISYDMTNLRKHDAYCPHWIWAVLYPIYLFMRQHKNKLGLGYFAFYWILTLIVPKILDYILRII